MKFEMMVKKTFDAELLHASMQVRYWEAAVVNDERDDEDGSLIPCRYGDLWTPYIELETGFVRNWPLGTRAKVHYKVCDAGVYTLIARDGTTIVVQEGYVPRMLGPEGYGDYVILEIDADGVIKNWKPDLAYFNTDD